MLQVSHIRQNKQAVLERLEIKNFVWKGMNLYYLWQADVPDLADDRFSNQSQLNAFLETYTILSAWSYPLIFHMDLCFLGSRYLANCCGRRSRNWLR